MTDSALFVKIFTFTSKNPHKVDFSQACIAKNLKEAIFSAVCSIGGAYAPKSLAVLVYGARYLIAAVERTPQISKNRAFPTDMLPQIKQDLATSKLAWRSRNLILHKCAAILSWIRRNRPSLIAKNATLSVESFRDDSTVGRRRKHLGDEELRQIMYACEEAIDEYWERFQYGQRLLNNGATNSSEQKMAEVLIELQKLGDGIIPRTAKIRQRAPHLLWQALKLGGIFYLRSLCYLTVETFIPFYVHLTAQLAGNATSIHDLSRDCIVSHEIYGNSERVVWHKGRSSQQSRSFDIRKKNAAPNLVRKLLAMTEVLTRHVRSQDANKIFIHQYGSEETKQINWETVHNRLSQFIKDKNLPSFAPADLRPTVADLHDQRGGIFAAKQALGHKKITTTQSYLNKKRIQETHDKVILKFQGILHLKAKNLNSLPSPQSSLKNRRATIFGFDCKDPFSGIAPGSRIGEKCIEFKNCATCPGALVVLDDPIIVAKLYQTRAHLALWRMKAHTHGWGERFSALYQDTLDILDNEILPLISEPIRSSAYACISSLPSLPDLE